MFYRYDPYSPYHYFQLTPDAKNASQTTEHSKTMASKKLTKMQSEDTGPAESFFDLLSRCQSERMDDQRATLAQVGKANQARKHSSMKLSKLQRSASNDTKHNVRYGWLQNTRWILFWCNLFVN